ncbi:MAG: amidohydrolase family protein [Patescibacteria group bacterium]|nr:amidohydrolase family protein [Patescibacteria group bacterium]
MKTIDIHTHLLNPNVNFNRILDKIIVPLVAKRVGLNRKKLRKNKYQEYINSLIFLIKNSKYLNKACLMGVDSKFDINGKETHRDKTICAHTQDVLNVYNQYPNLIIPFLSINPLRKNALDLIDKYVQAGCKGAKFLQNYWNIDTNNKNLIPYYERLKIHNIPLIIHTGSEHTIKSNKHYEKTDILKLPLEVGVKVIAAHMASGHIDHKLFLWKNLSKKPKNLNKEYYKLLKMLKTYPNLYADVSAIVNPVRARTLNHLSQQKHIHHKLLFGTDFPLPVFVRLNTLEIDSKTKKKIAKIKNPFDKYIEIITYFFQENNPIFTNYKKILKL